MMDRWTEAEKATLREMWEKDMSAAEIAKALGKISRNSILGMANRMGLPKHRAPANKKQVDVARKPMAYVPRASKPPTISASIATVVTSSGVSLMDVKDGQCHAIIGKSDDGFARYCGQPVKEGRWCCEPHFLRFYNAPRWGTRA